jgi:hypothetical protein
MAQLAWSHFSEWTPGPLEKSTLIFSTSQWLIGSALSVNGVGGDHHPSDQNGYVNDNNIHTSMTTTSST